MIVQMITSVNTLVFHPANYIESFFFVLCMSQKEVQRLPNPLYHEKLSIQLRLINCRCRHYCTKVKFYLNPYEKSVYLNRFFWRTPDRSV